MGVAVAAAQSCRLHSLAQVETAGYRKCGLHSRGHQQGLVICTLRFYCAEDLFKAYHLRWWGPAGSFVPPSSSWCLPGLGSGTWRASVLNP